MTTTLQTHPLSVLVARSNLSAAAYLKKVADRHRLLGYGSMAYRREKLTRWTSGTTPERSAQLAIAHLHGIAPAEVDRLGWPAFLLRAFPDDQDALEVPWTPQGTVTALISASSGSGEHMELDRRGFLVTTAGALATTLAHWSTAAPAIAVDDRRRRVGADAVDLFESRLSALRHLDDTVGAGRVYDAALLELRLVSDLLSNASYTTPVGRKLFGCAAEAARLAGWCAYDADRHAQAERHFVTSMRASASADDPTIGALTLGFWANLRYNAGDPRGALDLVDAALAERHAISSPRVRAMLHARAARAHSKAGEATAAWRSIDAAFSSYGASPPPREDLAQLYWVNHGELHQVAASSALALSEPSRALQHFQAAVSHEDPYDEQREVRGAVIYQARQAEAHLALGDVDAAVDLGHQVIQAMGGVESERSAGTLVKLRGILNDHRENPAVQDFLDYAA
ncbi:hypothetical protein [Nocardiopsis coralliicola]